MRNLIDFNAVTLHTDRADHVMPGDWIAVDGGVGAYAFRRVRSVSYHEDNRPNAKDRVEFTLDVPTNSWSTTTEMFVDRVVRFGR